MDDGGELIGGVGKNVDGNFLVESVVSLVDSLGNEAGELGKLCGSANRRVVLVKNLISGRLVGRPLRGVAYDLNPVRIIRRNAVLIRQAWNRFRVVCGAMAGITGHLALTVEVGPIERVHHDDHLARSLL